MTAYLRLRAASIAATALALVACAVSTEPVAYEAPDAGPAPTFVVDAGAATSDASPPLLCAVNACPAGHVTCPASLFPCQVDLDTDKENCGACGNACPSGTQAGAAFSCIGGQCVASCTTLGGIKVFDCNGYSGDGCEVSAATCDQANCGGCGGCTGGQECVYTKAGPRCGCGAGLTQCGSGCSAACTVLAESDDRNCAACGDACNPLVGTVVGTCKDLENTYFGCRDGACGARKCASGFGDCDNDLNRCPSTGCETLLAFDHDNCGACKNKCKDTEQCITGQCTGSAIICKPGEVACAGFCANLGVDPFNCGACGVSCEGFPNGTGTCSRGACVNKCLVGFADCDGWEGNGCETDLAHDPEHCGGCGTTCDLVAGQPCIDGLCLRGPCGPGSSK